VSGDAQAVLYDAPGPRARRITLISSVIAGVAVAGLVYALIYRPLDKAGQFTMEKWGPLVDPSNESFALLWGRLGEGFRATLTAAALAIVASLVVGTALAVLRIQLKALLRRRFVGESGSSAAGFALRALVRVLNAVTRFCVEVFRGIPVVITIFFVWVGLPKFGVDFDTALGYLVIGLAIYNSVVIAEILRSGMEGLPTGQREAAEAIGLSPLQTTLSVLLPQAFRIMLPALISQLVVVLKDTSLGFIISYEEVLRVSSQTIQVLENPIQTYIVVGAIYIGINYVLSRLAVYTQQRVARGRKTPPGAAPQGVTLDAQAPAGAGGVASVGVGAT
jgi:glutamate transport system permease protein